MINNMFVQSLEQFYLKYNIIKLQAAIIYIID